MIYENQRDKTLDNKKCEQCKKEIPHSNNLSEDTIIYCNYECVAEAWE